MVGRKIFASLVVIAFLYITSPLIFPVIMGAILAVLFIPWLERLEHHKVPSRVGAAALTLGITLVLLVPTSLLVFIAAKNGVEQLHEMHATPGGDTGWVDMIVNSPKTRGVMDWVTTRFPVGTKDLIDATADLVRSTGAKMGDLLAGLVTHLPGMMMAMAIIVVSVYFFLMDGRKLVAFFRRNSIFTPAQTEELIHALSGICSSVILASVVAGVAQATVETAFCVAVGMSNVVIIGMGIFIASFVPVIGSMPITLGLALFEFLSGSTTGGITLLFAALLVAMIDNLIRPWFIQGRAHLHPMLAFVAAFGGLQTLGFLGIFIGPVVAAMFMVTIHILSHEGHRPSGQLQAGDGP